MDSDGKSFLLLSAAYDEASVASVLRGASTTGIARLAQEIRAKGTPVELDPRAVAGVSGEMARECLMELIAEHKDRFLAVGIQLPFSESVPLNPSELDTDYAEIDPLILLVRSRGIPLILGGNAITLDAEGTLRRMRERLGACLDGTVAVSGEADRILPELLKQGSTAWQNDARLYRVVDGHVLPGQMQLLSTQELHDLKPLQDPSVVSFEATGRGCKQNCTFCAIPGLSGGPKSMRSFEPKQFVEQVKFFIQSGVTRLGTTDADLFDVGLPWWKEALAQAEEAGLLSDLKAFIFSGYTNAFRLKIRGGLGLEELSILKQLGFRDLGLGVQSTDATVLRNVHRPPVDLDTLYRFFEQCHALGMNVSPDMILGLPGHTDSSSEKDLSALLGMVLQGASARDVFLYQHRRGAQTFEEVSPPPVPQSILHRRDKIFAWNRDFDAIRVNSRTPEEVRRFFPFSVLDAPLITPQEVQSMMDSLRAAQGFDDVFRKVLQRVESDAESLLDPVAVVEKWGQDIEVERACLDSLRAELSPAVYGNVAAPYEKKDPLNGRIARYQQAVRRGA